MKTVLLTNQDETEHSLVFLCPGCGEHHPVRIRSDNAARPSWKWNGNRERPTFEPSLLVRCAYVDGRPTRVCHSFVTDGRIQFLSDCTHDKAGQTVDLPDCDWND